MSNDVFEKAFNSMPKCLVAGYDSFHHKSVKDLWWMARIQLDLYEEDEDSDIVTDKDLRHVKNWMSSIKKDI